MLMHLWHLSLIASKAFNIVALWSTPDSLIVAFLSRLKNDSMIECVLVELEAQLFCLHINLKWQCSRPKMKKMREKENEIKELLHFSATLFTLHCFYVSI